MLNVAFVLALSTTALTDTQGKAIVAGVDALIGCGKGAYGYHANGRSMIDGCLFGVLAGEVMFGGSYVATRMNYPGAGFTGKLIHDFGNSIQDNMLGGYPGLTRFRTELGPVEIEAKHVYRWNWDFDYSFTALPAAGIILGSILGKFDWRSSLSYGVPMFAVPDKYTYTPFGGITLGQTILYNSLYNNDWVSVKRNVITHEVFHTHQWSELSFMGDEFKLQRWKFGQDVAYIALGVFSSANITYTPLEYPAYVMNDE